MTFSVACAFAPPSSGHLWTVAGSSILHGPTNNRPGKQVDDHCQVEPAFCGPNVSDVACINLNRFFWREVPIQQVWCDRQTMPRVGGRLKASLCFRSQAIFLHQAGNAIFAAGFLLFFERLVNAGTAVSLPAIAMYGTDFFPQLVV